MIPLANGKFKAVISVVDATGKRRRPSKTCRTKAEAHAAKRQLLAEYDSQSGSASTGLTLSHYLNQWWTSRVDGIRAKNTAASYRMAIDKYIGPRIGRHALRKVTPRIVEQWIAEMRHSELGARTIQNSFVVLKSALKRAVRLGEISSNPCDMVDRPKYESPEVFPFQESEARAIIEESYRERLGLLIRVALLTGARQGELFGIRWEDVDFTRGAIHIRQQVIEGVGYLEISKLKTTTSRRSIEIPEFLIGELNQHRAAMLKESHLRELAFVDTRGGMIRKSNFAKIWKRIQDNAGVSVPRGFHHCRHTYCTIQLSNGVPPKVVATVTGHKNVAVLLNTYAHVLDGMQEKARDMIESRLKIS